MDWLWIIQLLVLGTCTGFLAGMLGIGGGLVLVPFLTILMGHIGVAPGAALKMSVATSLATICFTSVSSVRAHHSRGAVRWGITRWLAPGIVIGSMAGAQIAGWMPAKALALFFTFFVSFSALQMYLDRKPKPSRELPGPGGLAGVGGVIGVLSAIVGAGGAFVSVPFMVACNVPIHAAVGTASSLGFPIALAGTIGYVVAGWNLHDTPPWTLGYIHLPSLLAVATASMTMAPLGARTAHGMDVVPLKRAFSMLLFGIAGYMLYKGITL